MLDLLYIPIMAILARQSGGGLGAQHLPSWLPEALFAAVIAFAVFPVYGLPSSLLCAVWSYMWKQTGHGVVLPWGGKLAEKHKKRTQTLTVAVTFLADALKIKKFKDDGYSRTLNYCRLFMSVKGFLIGLPLGGLPLAILWPLGYEIGNRYKSHTLSELAAGAGAGVSIILFRGLI